jgi:hypothetical protein
MMRQSSEPYYRVIGGFVPHLFPDARIICLTIRCV